MVSFSIADGFAIYFMLFGLDTFGRPLVSDSASVFNRLRHVLQNTYFFHALKMNELDDLIGHLRMIRVQKGYEIIKQGDPGDAFYLIAQGKVSVWKKKAIMKSKVAELKADDFFGEMALISNEPRNATVVAVDVTELFFLLPYPFDKLVIQ